MATSTAFGQAVPEFRHDEEHEIEDLEKVEWKGEGQAGLILTTGNSRVTTFSGGASMHRLAHRNKFSAQASGAYARTKIAVGQDANDSGTIDPGEIGEESQTSTEAWLVKARYDRFVAAKDSLYVLGKLGAEVHAGKALVAGGQLGYSRSLVRTAKIVWVLEIGYDFSHERYSDVEDSVDSVSIHSARGFVGYDQTLTEDTGFKASVEALLNLNELDAPGGTVDPGQDLRVDAEASLKTRIWENISFATSFTLRYDHAPGPRPALGLPYTAGYTPLADNLDTITEAQLVVTFQ